MAPEGKQEGRHCEEGAELSFSPPLAVYTGVGVPEFQRTQCGCCLVVFALFFLF